jgi:hypothetical protein
MKSLSYLLKDIVRLLLAVPHRLSGRHFLHSPKTSSMALVLGNGPSIHTDSERIRDLIREGATDLYCVNSFPVSEEFLDLKPRHLILADPGFWKSDVTGEYKRIQDSLFKALENESRDFMVNIYLPAQARKSTELIRRYEAANARVYYFNSNPWRTPFLKWTAYQTNLAAPIIQNVIIGALYIAIAKKHRTVVLFGADHSWHKQMVIRSDNVLCFKNDHFFDEGTYKPFFKDVTEKDSFTLKEWYQVLVIMFTAYEELLLLGCRINSKIYNLSSESFIDVFPRKMDP